MKVVQEGSLKNPSFHGIIIKDPHCNWGFANRIRHNHEDDLDFKWGFLQDYMNQNNIQDLIITGDLVDSNDEKKWSFKQYYKNKEKLLKFKQSKSFWSIAGNHDMLNGFEGVNETPFGEFVRENVIEHLTNKPICLGENSWIYGIDYSKHKEVTKNKLNGISLNHSNINGLIVAVIHAHVTPNEVGCTEWTYNELLENFPGIDVFVCGHYHGGFPVQIFLKKIKQPDGTFIDDPNNHVVMINPWSFQRVVRDYYNEMDIHIPEFVEIKTENINDEWYLEFKNIQVPVKSYEETFKPKVVELLKVTRKEHFKFFETVNFDDIKVGANDEEILVQFAEADNLDKSVIIKALEYLNNVQVSDD